MRISLLILLLNALIFTQLSASAEDDAKLKGALLKAMKKHDTATVKAIADGGHESIDRDDILQMKIFEYLDAEQQRVIQAKEKAAADAAAKKAAEEKAKTDKAANIEAEKKAAAAAAVAAEEKKKKDAAAAIKAAEEKKRKEAAAKKNAEAKAAAAQKAAEEKKKKDALAAKKAKEDKARKAKAAEKKRKEAAIAKKAEEKRKAAAAAEKKAAAKKAAAPKPKAVAVPAAVVAPAAAVAAEDAEDTVAAEDAVTAEAVEAAPLSVSDKELVGTWKQVSSEKVITLNIGKDRNFVLEQVEDDGTLTISGTWKSEENIFMMSIKKVQRNVHTRETDIHRIYKVDRLSNHRFVLLDKRDRIAYDLKR